MEELQWLETQLFFIRAEVTKNPYDKIQDRTSGNILITSEYQKKCQRETLLQYINIFDRIQELRKRLNNG